MHSHPEIGIAQAGFQAHFVGFQTDQFAQHKYLGHFRRQIVMTSFVDGPELLLIECRLWIVPAGGAAIPVAIAHKKIVFISLYIVDVNIVKV